MLRAAALLTIVSPVLAQVRVAPDATHVYGPSASSSAPTPTLFAPPLASMLSSWSDNFDRPNAATLGASWTVQTGAWGIDNNRGWATGTSSQWVLHASAASSYANAIASIDFLPKVQGSNLVYVALVFGVSSQTDNVFLKVQDNNSDGTYDRVYFYKGINGSTWSGNTGSSFALAVPTVSGRMTCYFTNAGDTANIDIDNDFNGTVDEHFETNGVLNIAPLLGTGMAIGCFNSPAFDNWSAADGVPSGPVSYCTAGTSTNGCIPAISASAQPSASQASACVLSVANVEGQKSGLIFYGLDNTAFAPLPWATGSSSFLCVKPPTQRMTFQSSGGNSGQCDGTLTQDLNAFLSANPAALGQPFAAGQKLFAQAWYRDPQAVKTTNLSDAVELTFAP